MTGATGRLRQGMLALRSWVVPIDEQPAVEILTAPLLKLFQAMRAAERQHSLNVLRTLKARAETDRALWQAALLHDCGKCSAPYFLWERVLVVLAKTVAPGLVTRWGSGTARGWRRPFAVYEQHPAWGADLAARANADPLVVMLIRSHAQPIDQAVLQAQADVSPVDQVRFIRLLMALQAADDLN